MQNAKEERASASAVCARVLIATILSLACAPAFSALTVGAGSSLQYADGALDLGCSDLIIAGSAAGGSGNVTGIANVAVAAGGTFAPGATWIALGGDFSDAGTFAPGTSVIDIVDACGNGTSTVSGVTSFYDLLVSTTTGKQLVLPAMLTQEVTHALTLQGAPGNLLNVLSTSAGQQALLNVSTSAAQSIAYVDARDDKASGATIAPGTAVSYHSVDSGDLTNWFVNAVTGSGGGAAPAPTLGRWAALLLAALLAAFAWKRSHPS